MSTSEKQKAKKRKSRKAAKSSTNLAMSEPPHNLPAPTTSEELAMIQRLMDADEECGVSTPPPLRGPNPYLGGERCLLCRCERPDPPQHKPDNKTKEEDNNQDPAGVGTLSQLPLWVCPDCRKTVEEEEKKAAAYDSSALLEQELRLETPALSFLPDLAGDFTATSNSVCTCEACTERRQIEAEHEKETQELQQCWMELRHVVRCIYHETGTGLTTDTEHPDGGKASTTHDIPKMTTLVHRLCVRDAHQLYQRLESQGREYVIEMKVRLLKQLTSGHKTPMQAKQFVSMLLEEYANLCTAAKTLASFLTKLETEHLKRFNLTWELHNKHLFQSIIYSDPFVQNSLPMLIAQLRSGAASKEAYHEDTYPNILHRYLKFDDEMSVISVVWRDCQQLLEAYNDEQVALRAKQKMLKDDWEFFKAQRRLLEQQQQVLKKTPTATSAHSFEAQFTETMRHILQGTKPAAEECHCPNCNRKRCPCEECTMPQVVQGGFHQELNDHVQQQHLNDQVQQQLSEHVHHQLQYHQHHQQAAPISTACSTVANQFNIDSSSPYMIDVTPPSMSSTNSSSGSSSPINVDPKRLVLPLDVCPESFELTDDEIPEEIEEDESGSESDGDDDDDDDEDDEDEDDEGDEGDEDDYGGEGSDTIDCTTQIAEEGAELTAAMDGNHGNGSSYPEEDETAEYGDDIEALPSVPSAAPVLGLPLVTAEAMKTDCDCTHCTKARMEQQKPVEEVVNQCQCHACLMQSGKTVQTCLPQHVPTAPRPAAFNLYPHIHGSNSLHAAAALHAHSPHLPVLQSHLYELQSGPVAASVATTRQPKSLVPPAPSLQPKKHSTNFSLDLDSHEALHEHIYHAYGEWDNAYDSTKLMFSSHKYAGGLGSELFSAPPPPLMNGSPFVNVGEQLTAEAALSLTAAAAAAAAGKPSSVYQHGTMALNSPLTSMATDTAFANTSVATSNGEHIHTEACFKNMKPLNRTLLNSVQPLVPMTSCAASSAAGAATMTPTSPVLLASSLGAGTTSSGAAAGTTYSDHCLKHNPFLHTHHSSFTSTHATTTISASPPLPSHPLPVKLTQEMIRSAAMNVTKEETARSLANNPPGATALGLPHTCSHQHNPAVTGASQPFISPNPPNPQPIAGLQLLNNNITVSLPTGVCQDPECDGHHDAEYDSIDDSCSEQSSSTSTSNQKDGKYCDCCYCEFFGHSNPPQAPTSRNYAEIRDRLRLRLKKKTESQTSTVPPIVENIPVSGELPKVEEPQAPPPPPPKEEVNDDRGLEELLRFINGDEKDGKGGASSKAAKRARQKQKKAEEKARREAEQRLADERERVMKEQQEAFAKAVEEAKRQQQQQQQQQQQRQHKKAAAKEEKKKKSKHKESGKENEENRNPHNAEKGDGHHHQTDQKSQAGRAASGTNASGESMNEHKRGEPDGIPTSHHSASITAAATRMSAAAIDALSLKIKRHTPRIGQVVPIPDPALIAKAQAVMHANQRQEEATRKRGKGRSGQPVTCTAGLTAVSCVGNKNGVAQSQNPATHHHQRATKSPPHVQTAAQQEQQQPQPNGRANTNKAGNVKAPQGPIPTTLIRPEHINENTNYSHLQHLHQHILNNGGNNNKKGNTKKGGNMVNGVPLPAANESSPVPARRQANQVQNTAVVQTAQGQQQHGTVTGNNHGSADCPKGQMMNGNSSNGEAPTPHSSTDRRQGKLPPQSNTGNRDVKTKVEEKTTRSSEQVTTNSGAKPKKNKRKNKSAEDLDEIFMPKDLDPDNGEIDELDREIEEFKRFCLDSTPMPKREKLQVNMNLKDIFNKKKSGVSCA